MNNSPTIHGCGEPEPQREQQPAGHDRVRVAEYASPPFSCPARVIEENAGEGTEVDALQTQHRQGQADEHPVQVERQRTYRDRAEAERQREQQAHGKQHDTGLEQEEFRVVDEHGAQVDPCGVVWGEPARTLVMRQSAVTVFVEGDRDFRGPQPHADRLQHHLGGVLPRLGRQVHAAQRLTGDAPHPAVDVAEVTAVQTVQDPGRGWRAEVPMQSGHRSWLDRTLPARAHRVLGAAAHRVDEGRELAEVVGAVGVTHDHVLAAHVRQGVEVGAAESALGGLEDTRPASQSELGCAVRRTVDNEHLAHGAGSTQPFVAPSDEFRDGEFFVHRRDKDGHLGRLDVVCRYRETAVRIASQLDASVAHTQAP
jgi:hypothetical protein